MSRQQDDSFFAPSAAGTDSHNRARAMFGLPGDPTAARGAPTQFDASFDSAYEGYDDSLAYQQQRHGNREIELDDSMEYGVGHEEASRVEPSSEGYHGYDTTNPDVTRETEQEEEEGHEHEPGDTTYPESDVSSIDPDEDPIAWAERLDEIAGKLEMSEAEARALRWGPAIGSQQQDHVRLNHADLLKLVDHHLTTTEWRFNKPREQSLPGMTAETHPNRVLGRAYIAQEAGRRMDPLVAMRQNLLDSGYGSMSLG